MIRRSICPPPRKPTVGDVVFYNTQTKEVFATSDFYKFYNIEHCYLIGIVVIPEDHNVYKTGESGVISVRCSSLDNFEGTNYWESSVWAIAKANNTDTEITNFSTVASCKVPDGAA